MATIPHWKALIREAQEEELKAARLRVQRLRTLRASERFVKLPKSQKDNKLVHSTDIVYADALEPTPTVLQKPRVSVPATPVKTAPTHISASETAETSVDTTTDTPDGEVKPSDAQAEKRPSTNTTSTPPVDVKPSQPAADTSTATTTATSITDGINAQSDSNEQQIPPGIPATKPTPLDVAVEEKALVPENQTVIATPVKTPAEATPAKKRQSNVRKRVSTITTRAAAATPTPAKKKKPLGESKAHNVQPQKRASTTATTAGVKRAPEPAQLVAGAAKRRAALKQTSDKMYETLKAKTTVWTDRIKALEELGKSAVVIDTRMARALGLQLLELRSRIVVTTSETVCQRAGSLSLPDAIHIGKAALDGVHVNKAVMSKARAKAFAAVMAPHGKRFNGWDFLLDQLGKHKAERARVACAKAVATWVSQATEKHDALIAAALRTALEDSQKSVRDEGKNLWVECAKLGDERRNKIRDIIGPDAAVRLPGKTANSNKRASVRDMMRQQAPAPRPNARK